MSDENIYNFSEFKKPEENKTNNSQNPFAKFSGIPVKDTNKEILEENFYLKINDYLKELDEDTLKEIFELLKDKLMTYKLEKLYPEEKIKELEKSEYDKGFADEILKNIKDENVQKKLLNLFFNNQRGNKLLLISYLTRKKIKTPGFMEELEKNYGVLLNCSDYLKEIKTTIESINSYKELYKFIDCDIIGEQSEFDYIIKKYQIAKKKRYIKVYYDEDHPKPEKKKFYNKGKDLSKSNNDVENNDGEGEWETVGSKKNDDYNDDNNNYYNNNNYYHNNYQYHRGNNYHRGRGR